jgi:hypothetical protein
MADYPPSRLFVWLYPNIVPSFLHPCFVYCYVQAYLLDIKAVKVRSYYESVLCTSCDQSNERESAIHKNYLCVTGHSAEVLYRIYRVQGMLNSLYSKNSMNEHTIHLVVPAIQLFTPRATIIWPCTSHSFIHRFGALQSANRSFGLFRSFSNIFGVEFLQHRFSVTRSFLHLPFWGSSSFPFL